MIGIEQLNRYIAPLKRKVLSIIGKALIEDVNDNTNIQTVKISLLRDELVDEVERIQNFGFTSNPPENSEAVAVNVGGDRSNMIVIVVDNADSRLKGLASGESAVYNAFGAFIKLLESTTMPGQTKIIISGNNIFVGGETGAEKIPLGDSLKTYLDSFINDVFTAFAALPAGTSVQNAAAITALQTAYNTWVAAHFTDSYLSTKHKVN